MIREPGDLPGLVELYSAPNRGRSVVATLNINQPRGIKITSYPGSVEAGVFLLPF